MPKQKYTRCSLLDFTPVTTNAVWRPMLGLTLSNGDHRVPCSAIIDSGADSCVFPGRFMKLLGLLPVANETLPVMGVGSANETYFYPVTITIEDAQGIAPFVTKVGFTADLDGWGVGALG